MSLLLQYLVPHDYYILLLLLLLLLLLMLVVMVMAEGINVSPRKRAGM